MCNYNMMMLWYMLIILIKYVLFITDRYYYVMRIHFSFFKSLIIVLYFYCYFYYYNFFRKFSVTDGTRYFWKARFVSTIFDASPPCLIEIERYLKNQDGVLRVFTIKHTSAVERSTCRNYKNPYLDV